MVGVVKPARVRVRRETPLDRSGVMAEVMSLSSKEFKRFYRMDKATFLFVLGRVISGRGGLGIHCPKA
jgi:hypothetical protein